MSVHLPPTKKDEPQTLNRYGELEFELVQSRMAQKPVLQGEVYFFHVNAQVGQIKAHSVQEGGVEDQAYCTNLDI